VRIFSLIALSSLLILVSCKEKDRFAAKIKTLDSLHVELDKKTAVFLSLDSQRINFYLKRQQQNMKLLSDSLKDTLSVNYFNVLTQYKKCEAPLQFLNENYKSILNESLLSKEQLKKLSVDLKNDAIEDELVYEYFIIEKMEAEKMSETLTANYNLAKQSTDTFQKYNEKIEQLIHAIQNKIPY
jgi:hypothetical protein